MDRHTPPSLADDRRAERASLIGRQQRAIRAIDSLLSDLRESALRDIAYPETPDLTLRDVQFAEDVRSLLSKAVGQFQFTLSEKWP